MEHWLLDGMKAVVSGASKGIGQATTEELLALGAEVLFLARSEDLIRQLQQDYDQKGWRAHGLVADVGQEAERQRIIDWVGANWGSLDILVNNVGTNVRKPTLEATAEDLQEVMNVNVGSAFALCTGLYPYLKKGRYPSITNVASIAAKTSVMWTTGIYAMSKAAMNRMTQFLAVDWGKDGIRVNSVNPWFIHTERVSRVTEDAAKMARINEITPLGRIGKPEEVARTIAFLSMPAASYLSGVTLEVDGAFSQVGIL